MRFLRWNPKDGNNPRTTVPNHPVCPRTLSLGVTQGLQSPQLGTQHESGHPPSVSTRCSCGERRGHPEYQTSSLTDSFTAPTLLITHPTHRGTPTYVLVLKLSYPSRSSDRSTQIVPRTVRLLLPPPIHGPVSLSYLGVGVGEISLHLYNPTYPRTQTGGE